MGNSSSRNDHLPIPPGFMPPNYPGYTQLTKSSSWNPFKRNKMKKREQALREYLYTTPMIIQYPNAFTVAQPGHNLVQHGIPQIHSAIPVAPANGFAAQVGIPVGAPMGIQAAGNPQAAPTATTSTAPVIPQQMMPMAYPAAMDYSAYPDLRSAMASFFPRRTRRSQRHRTHHRSRRRSPSPSTESSVSETVSSSYGSPSSYDSAEYRRPRGASQRDQRHQRSGSARNPLPRPPKDVLASTPFRPLLSQLPSAHYSAWGTSNNAAPPPQVPMPQPHPAQPPQPSRKERSGGFFRRRRDPRYAVPSLTAAAQPFIPPGMGAMPMPMADTQPPPRSMPTPGHPTATPVLPPVIPGSAQMSMRMPEPDQQQHQQQQPPVIPPGMGPGSPNPMPMPSPAPAGSTPFIGGAGLTPAVVPPGLAPGGPVMGSGQTMHVSIGASPSMRPMSMPAPGAGMQMQMGMGMPSPGGAGAVQPLRFNGYGEYSGLLYHSPHTVMYEDDLYPTALHLFEALKFLERRPDLAERIRLCERVEDVTAISTSFSEHTRRDWGNIALATMDEVLYRKFRQHGDLRALLLGTFPAELIFVESGDAFWGDGAGPGRNELGNSLMRVRERFRNEGGM